MDKRLTKGNDKVLAGVCSGIANYFGCDVTIVRLLFALFGVLYGVGLLFYIICAIIIPNE